jgi:demethylmenaquinone methyltransferase/2-methoxy-6-polyprenyl-1,4-benzoquinol methylase
MPHAREGSHSHHHGGTKQSGEAEPSGKSLERMNRFQEPEARRIIDDLGLPPGSRGLDVGCGVGLYGLWLAEAVGSGGHVVGIEPEEERVEAARSLVGGRLDTKRLAFREGDGTSIPEPARSFDWIWCGDVLHHIVETEQALKEFLRVVRPGGRIIIKESQVLSALFLPGHPELERRIQLAEISRTLDEGGGRSFQERRQTTLASLRAIGLPDVTVRTYLLERRAPLGAVDHDYIQSTVFTRNWGERLRELLTPEDRTQRSMLCDAGSPENILKSPDYFCVYPITVFAARIPS